MLFSKSCISNAKEQDLVKFANTNHITDPSLCFDFICWFFELLFFDHSNKKSGSQQTLHCFYQSLFDWLQGSCILSYCQLLNFHSTQISLYTVILPTIKLILNINSANRYALVPLFILQSITLIIGICGLQKSSILENTAQKVADLWYLILDRQVNEVIFPKIIVMGLSYCKKSLFGYYIYCFNPCSEIRQPFTIKTAIVIE